MNRLVLIAILVLALEHGLAGAATHLPHHPDHTLMAVADSFSSSHECGAEPHESGHDGTACEIITAGDRFHQPALAAVSAVFMKYPHPAIVLHDSCLMPSRSPPKPSLAALSVLRV